MKVRCLLIAMNYFSPRNLVNRVEVSDSVWDAGPHIGGGVLLDGSDRTNNEMLAVLFRQKLFTSAVLGEQLGLRKLQGQSLSEVRYFFKI